MNGAIVQSALQLKPKASQESPTWQIPLPTDVRFHFVKQLGFNRCKTHQADITVHKRPLVGDRCSVRLELIGRQSTDIFLERTLTREL